MTLWFGLLTALFLAAILTFLFSRDDFDASPAFLFPLFVGFYAFGYGLMTGSFKFEARKARTRLRALLGGSIQPR